MSNVVLLLGRSGSGKSTSLRNFKVGEIGVFSVAHKRLPFKSQIGVALHPTYALIEKSLKQNKLKAYCIDDANYLMAFDNFAFAEETGYNKFVRMAKSFEQLLVTASNLDDDTNVYFMMHSDVDSDGREKPKTVGRMLDSQLCVEGLFPIVIDARTRISEDGTPVYEFITQNDGTNLAKAPVGMLDPVMPNDLKEVDTRIRDFWGMKPITPTKKKVD